MYPIRDEELPLIVVIFCGMVIVHSKVVELLELLGLKVSVDTEMPSGEPSFNFRMQVHLLKISEEIAIESLMVTLKNVSGGAFLESF